MQKVRSTMKLAIALVAPFFAVATAFVPSPKTAAGHTSSTALDAFMNGFTPDESKFCYGLPGAVAPFKEGFDPFFISERNDYETIKTFRESEVTHGRVAMLAGKCMWSCFG
jgi:hypothetical protein